MLSAQEESGIKILKEKLVNMIASKPEVYGENSKIYLNGCSMHTLGTKIVNKGNLLSFSFAGILKQLDEMSRGESTYYSAEQCLERVEDILNKYEEEVQLNNL